MYTYEDFEIILTSPVNNYHKKLSHTIKKNKITLNNKEFDIIENNSIKYIKSSDKEEIIGHYHINNNKHLNYKNTRKRIVDDQILIKSTEIKSYILKCGCNPCNKENDNEISINRDVKENIGPIKLFKETNLTNCNNNNNNITTLQPNIEIISSYNENEETYEEETNKKRKLNFENCSTYSTQFTLGSKKVLVISTTKENINNLDNKESIVENSFFIFDSCQIENNEINNYKEIILSKVSQDPMFIKYLNMYK
ncbi:hypothetical protein DDB_G0288585 [Dictyostelium discoideum AX4]|uniref:Uncharacterized protein n=1 Tax=Dictyostelium discoideum TaxID=44689 RepID=Q54IQ7_DICDI|nr:hypothetical protein DDB_G0288585 [Dictyostelium discoideum AX4]EAL63152.1 hypothetical protein DDB_G0288585 [Dictyostelium discoideum AX4]|eukprot:XP_636657.1 hypothetical protein DDB_G0288585 [Dictyostelium discoideum AX4]